MRHRVTWSLVLALLPLANGVAAPAATPGVDEIIAHNVAARGGAERWRAVQTMTWQGHLDTAAAQGEPVPFAFTLKRPNKTRFEVNSMSHKGLRVFDGDNGWKVRLNASGTPEVSPYTNEEKRYAHDVNVIDGWLIDYKRKGLTVTLVGKDDLDGAPAYCLRVVSASGAVHYLWIDAKTFLERREDRELRDPLGHVRTASLYYSNYLTVDGLKLPGRLESRGPDGKVADALLIDRVVLNPPTLDPMFAKPMVGSRSGVVSIGTDPQSPTPANVAPAAGVPAQPPPGQ